MSWLLRHNWPWSLLAFLLGAAITWVLLDRRHPAPALAEEPAEEEPVLVGAAAAPRATPPPASAPPPPPQAAPA
jgi:hypothetical protein